MKRIVAIILALILIISITACGDKQSPVEDGNNPAAVENKPVEENADLPRYTFTQFGNAQITIVGTEFDVDEYGEDFLRVYYDYTNTGDNVAGQYPGYAVNFGTITQNGAELSPTTFSDMDASCVPEDLNGNISVMPGASVRSTVIIPCSPKDGVVTIPFYVMIGNFVYDEDEIEYFTLEVDPKNTMGAPKSAFTYSKMENPGYTDSMATSAFIDTPLECEVSIDGWEITSDYDGANILRVFLTYTNNSDDFLAPMSMAYADAFQDGASLEVVAPWNVIDANVVDELYIEDLYPSETVECSALFLLRSDSPVEVVIEPLDCDACLGMRCDVDGMLTDRNVSTDGGFGEFPADLIGTWTSTDGWDDSLVFYADGTGIHNMTGDEYGFCCEIDGDQIFLYYDDGDEGEYTFEVWGDRLILADIFGDTQSFARGEVGGGVSDDEEFDSRDLVGYWLDVEAGENESFTFESDGTGVYTYLDEVYSFEYETDEDYIDIYFEDGDYSGFYWAVDGDVLNLYGSGIDWYLDKQN